MPSAGQEIHCEKPIGQGGAGFLEGGADAWIDVMSAVLAGIGAPLGDAVELGVRAAARAANLFPAVADGHDLVQARGIIRVLGAELLDGVLHG